MERISLSKVFFAAPWGSLLKGMTLGGTVILLGLPAYVLYFDKVPPGGPSWLFYGLPLIYLITYFFTVRGYEVEGNELRIVRPGWKKVLLLSELSSVEFIPRAMHCSIRIIGNGGLFSFVGNYRNALLGPYKAYVTDFHKTVVLKFPDRTVVVSPEDPARFHEMLAQAVRSIQTNEQNK